MRALQLLTVTVVALGTPAAAVGAPAGAEPSARSPPTVYATAAGGDPAAAHIAAQFMGCGLKPAGDNGTYFEDVPLTEVRTLPDTSWVVVASDLGTLTLRNLEDVVGNNEAQTPSAYVDAPIVFVGYGIRAPEYGRDDYKDLDLDGKVALLLANEPRDGDGSPFPPSAPTRYGSAGYKFAEAARRGAVAALIIHAPLGSRDTWGAVRHDWGTRFYWRPEGGPRLEAAAWIEPGAARRLVALAGLDLETLTRTARTPDFTPIALALRLQAHVASAVRAVAARNVLAALPGRGGSSEEAVLYMARYGQLGSEATPAAVPKDLDGDRAGDATGVATLLEAARLWSRRSAAPPRMILFAALAAEGDGLPAADSFVARNGAVRPGRISVVLSYESPPPGAEPQAVVVRGEARTRFSASVAAAAKALGLTLDSEPYPGSDRDYESGAYRLALAGVPSLTLAGRPGRRTSGAALAATQFAGDAALARFGYRLGVEAASASALIRWRTGDEFEAVRSGSQLIQPGNKPLERKPRRVR